MDSPPKRPTLKTVAKLAGVSEATASRALSNHPRHSKKTCERIQKIAQEIGYTRHPFISVMSAD
ncbi:MAG: LacI family DNA-binding transcriptional regulator, partial [Verrucomicrobiota bacterium]